jgi:hypothetical protein
MEAMLSRITLSDGAESTVFDGLSPLSKSLPPCSRPSRTSPSGGRQAAPILDRHSTRRRSRAAVGTEKWLCRDRTEKFADRQFSCQLFVFKLNEGADGVSIAICAQKHRGQASICVHKLTMPRTSIGRD